MDCGQAVALKANLMKSQKETVPTPTALMTFTASDTPVYFHQPWCNPKERIVIRRMATKTGATERSRVRFGSVNSKRTDHANRRASKIRTAWNIRANREL